MNASIDKTAIIAAMNDAFRKSIRYPSFKDSPPLGTFYVTSGVGAFSEIVRLEIFTIVANFDDFTDDNDPYGEHDFGAFTHPQAGKLFWKIDYYDPDMEHGSEDPSDRNKTFRVLTIMLAEEY